MSILQAIYQFLFGPLELFFEVVYGVAFHIVDGNAGAAVIPLSCRKLGQKDHGSRNLRRFRLCRGGLHVLRDRPWEPVLHAAV